MQVTAKEGGKAVPDATISFAWTDIERRYKTNAAGVCQIAGLARDKWYFMVQADGFATTYRRRPQQPLGSTTELEFQLAPGYDLEGRVVSDGGVPIAGAQIRANVTEAPMTPAYGDTVSDDDGRFVLKSLPSGVSIWLMASKEGHYGYGYGLILPANEKTFKLKYDAYLQAELASAFMPVMPVGRDCIVTVVDEDGEPIVDAIIENMGNLPADVRTATTVADGTARLENLFSLTGPRFGDSTTRGRPRTMPLETKATIRARTFITQQVDLVPGPPEQPGEVTVKMIQGKQIHGRLIKPNGDPATGVPVYYNTANINNRGRARFNLGGRVDTDGEGRFFAEGLPSPSTFTFSTAAPFAPIYKRSLPVSGDDEVEVQMEMEGVIRVRAIDSVTKKPIPEFNVRLGHTSNPTLKPGQFIFDPRETEIRGCR